MTALTRRGETVAVGEQARQSGRIPSNWDTPVVIRKVSGRRVCGA